MKRNAFCLLFILAAFVTILNGCEDCESDDCLPCTDGDTENLADGDDDIPDGDNLDGDVSDGDVSDGDVSDGDITIDGDMDGDVETELEQEAEYTIDGDTTEIDSEEESDWEDESTEQPLLPQCEDIDEDGYFAGPDCVGVTDCNDRNKFVNPGVDDLCNFEDDDCDGRYDEDGIDCTAPCKPKMDCNLFCYGQGGTNCWNECQSTHGNEACDICYDQIVSCGYMHNCFPGGQWDEQCMNTYCAEAVSSCLGPDKEDGICGEQYLPCLDTCAQDDESCRTECYYSASFACRSCMNEYQTCLYDNDCVSNQGSIISDCFYEHCFEPYDYCILGFTDPVCQDSDEDGFGLYCPMGDDCDDGNPNVYPQAAEICNGYDDDCDGRVDEKTGESCDIEREWAFLVYFAGDNNLSDSAITELEAYAAMGGTTDDVVTAIQIELSGSYSSYRHVLDPSVFERTWRMIVPRDGSPDLNTMFLKAHSIGDENITDPEALANFLDWATSTIRAKNYVLTLWDHGGGWTGALVDEGSMEFMSMPLMREGLELSGFIPDVLLFSACDMGAYEVLVELEGLADYVVGSQEVSYGIPGEEILAHLHENPQMTPSELAIDAVDVAGDYAAEYEASHTWAAWNTQGTAALSEAVHALAGMLIDNLETLRPRLNEIMPGVQKMAVASVIDLVHFCQQMRPSGITAVDEQLELVETLALQSDFLLHTRIATGNPAPVWNPSLENAYGLSILLPTPVHITEHELEDYATLAVSTEDGNGWDEFINFWLGEVELARTQGNFRVDLTWTTDEGDASDVDLDLYLYEPGAGLFTPFMGETTANGSMSVDSLDSALAEEWYLAGNEVSAGSYYVFVAYQHTGALSPTATAIVEFTDQRFADNDTTVQRDMHLGRLCDLSESILGADVQAGSCTDFWLVGKLVRDDQKHGLVSGIYDDFRRESGNTDSWRLIPGSLMSIED